MIQDPPAEKLVLKTANGKAIPALTLEEALASGIDFTDRKSARDSKSSPQKMKYAPLTDECNLSSERGILISACEQLGDKPYIVLYTQRFGSTFGAVYIPAPRKKKVVS